MSEKEEITCKKANCDLPGVFYKDLPDGSTVLCVRVRHHKEKHVRELKLPPGIKRLEQV